MDNFESTFLRWICLFDEFKNNEYSNIKNLVSSTSFKQFVDNVFCLKCSSALSTEDTQVYNTIKVNYSEFEVQKHEDLYNEENSIYTCVVVLLHALLKCTNNKFRNQLSERMNNEEQELLANFLKAAQSLLFTKQNISEALMLISDSKHTSINTSEIYSNNNTPIKSKSMHRSYLQEFCESPKSQCLINQEKEKYITKLTEDYKNECEENYKLAENVKYLKDLNIKLSNKLEDKDKILQLLKDEIKEYSKPNQSPENKIDNTLIIKKLNRDKLDLEMNCNELKQQITELDKKHTELNGKFEKKTSDYNDLILMFDNIESENITLKRNLKLYEETIQAKDTEITSLKDELCNKSITNNPSNISGQEANSVPSNTLFNELSCLKLEEITHDKEKYRHKYKSIKRELSNSEIQVKELNDKIIILEKKLNDYETHKDELIDQFSNKIKELQECQKKKNNLESKIKHLKDNIKDNENHIESLCSKLNKRDKQIEILSVEIDSVKKSKTMIELILSKTNTEIEAIHEEHDEKVKKLQSIIEEYKNSEKLSHQSYIDLENNMKNVQDNLANKEHLIIYYEEKMAENYQTIGAQEEQLNTMYQEKLLLETHLKNIRIEIETQQKHFSDKNHEMENCLEYYLDELKDVKNEKTKIEEILHCKKNEIEQQLELINYQKDIIKTLQSEKCNQQVIINDLNEVVQQKSSENKDLSAKVLESTLDLNKLNEQLKVALADNNTIETNLKKSELQMKTLKEEFQCQINDMKNVLENQNNQCLIKVEQLQETIEKKQNDFNEQLTICNKLTETISQLQVEKFELEEKLKSSGQDLNQKQIQFEQATEENNKLKQTVDYTENQCLDLQHKLNELNNIILKKEEDIKLLEVDVSEYSVSKESLQNQVIETQQVLNNKNIELENQIRQKNEQRETIVKLNYEKECLGNKIKNLEDSLSHNEYKFNLCEGKLYDCSNTIDNLEKKINEMKKEKSVLEVELNETITKLSNVNQDLTLQLETNEKNMLETQEKLLFEQNELKKQIEKSNEQIKTISILNAEIDSLKEETDILQESLNKNDDTLKSLLEKVLICEKQYEDLQELKANLISELSENQLKLINLQDESKQQLDDMNIKYNEVHEKCNNKQIELDEYITKYNCLVETNTNLTINIDNLINKTDALESTLLNKDSVITANQEKLLEYEEMNKKIITEKTLMEVDLTQSLEKMGEIETKLADLQKELNLVHIRLETQEKENDQHLKTIFTLTSDKDNLINETKTLKDYLLEKEKSLTLNDTKLIGFKTQLNELQSQKNNLESEVSDTKVQLDNIQHDLTQKLEVANKKLQEVEGQHCNLQEEFNEQNKCSMEQIEKINSLMCEKNNLESEVSDTKLQLDNIQHDLTQKLEVANKKLQEVEEQRNNLQEELNEQNKCSIEQIEKINSLMCEKNNLESEVSDTKEQLDNIQHDLTQKLEVANKKLQEVEEQHCSLQEEFNEQNKCSMEQIEKINSLMCEKNNLESEVSDTKEQLDNIQHDLTQKLEVANKKLQEVEEQRNNLQEELNEQNKCSIEQIEKINSLMCEKNNLESEVSDTKEQLDNIQHDLTQKLEVANKKLQEVEEQHCSLQEEFNEQNKCSMEQIEKINSLMCEKNNLESEVSDTKEQLDNIQHDLTQKLEVANKKLQEVEEQRNNLQEELNEQNKCSIEQIEKINSLMCEKNNLESEVSDTKEQLDNIQHDLTQKLEIANKKLQEVEEQRNNLQEELNEQNKCSIEQIEKINSLMCEKNNLVNETNKLQEHLAQNEIDLELTQNKLQDYVKKNKEIESQITLLLTELNQLKCQMNKLRQESTEEIDKINKKNLKAQEELSNKESEIKEQIKLKNDSLIDIYQKINDLKNLKVELESILNKERKNFETYFETCLNYSFNHIQNKPIVDHHDSLIEVITSADTFIEQNGIQLAQVENCDEYFIIEKVKKIFEVLKMFIINLKLQGNEQKNDHISNESNEAYTELLAISKTQQATIKHLETEISTLKSECNHKMSKVQQKTQEYVTSEYEKKFERKREQMKQFCKDLEAKIHQDYETKLLKYKDKITKDEIHIKELGQQLWEVSEKYLKLQQKDRRESTMSLPFEMSMISETTTTLPKYNSFTLPKASSVGQIRSLVEETTRSYHDNTKRNVPAGIGKKFSLSSGKIFPKEEDEEGEMFNHSCLSDLKQGKVRLSDNKKQYNERLSELQARNSLCPPHLRSCYAVETNFLPNTSLVTEEDIKTVANYSDYETENLIPNDRNKKKDRNQTSYKKPGPPTPSKNGGRVSLSGNQKITLKESKETNTNKRRASSTPNKLFSLFMSKKN